MHIHSLLNGCVLLTDLSRIDGKTKPSSLLSGLESRGEIARETKRHGFVLIAQPQWRERLGDEAPCLVSRARIHSSFALPLSPFTLPFTRLHFQQVKFRPFERT